MINGIKMICVYCGASAGKNPLYAEIAHQMGRAIAENGLGLVYGGGSTGLMGAVADAALEKGAYTVGVIPQTLVDRELQHKGLHETQVVSNMHQRKWVMAERGDAFVALPGGFGTYEELFEVITWAQLGFHRKPIVLFNAADYFAPFIAMAQHGVQEGFIRAIDTTLISVATTVEEVFEKLRTYTPPQHTPRGLSLDQI
ncbi:MAG: TIGR00730 family Rossman fold protein [Anaerolineae bacterium]|jgi:hypothetical protein|nr:MAG: TIGR00730 family Rossman fold protein [Anaerolineae bacterium]MCL4879898.1 TIGR00730 family Rossman fold protein [Anaerolineae bacterium]